MKGMNPLNTLEASRNRRVTKYLKGPARWIVDGIPENLLHYKLFPLLSRQAASRYRRDVDFLLPQTVSLETRTICNGSCAFCAASVQNNTRKDHRMPDEVFQRCINELSDIHFSGRVAFFVNNEPLLDEKIADRVADARGKLPKAFLQISTNGIRLDKSIATALFEAGLDDLTVNAYVSDDKIPPHIRETVQALPEAFRQKTSVHVRDAEMKIANRAGSSPNASALARPMPAFCTFPFTQINIVHDGAVSLCCQDMRVQEIMGNVMDQGLLGVWFGERFREVRRSLLRFERRDIGLCELCDWRGFKSLEGRLSFLNRIMGHIW
jgi:Radical SAM superfamily/Iron-sulfur cluster-binding domain